jgi:translation initiation factor IF-3
LYSKGRCFSILEARINEEIREKEVRLIGADGNQLGVMPIKKALELAAEAELDLVEISPTTKPVVCKILDYGKFKYEKGKKEKEAKKKQKVIVVKELKIRPRIDKHDLEIKVKHCHEFIEEGNKVKVNLFLSGREKMYQEQGIQVLERLAQEFEGEAVIERKYGAEGQNFLILSPKNEK